VARERSYDVAFYVPWIGPLLVADASAPTGGAETQIFLLAKALAEAGVRVSVISFALEGAVMPPVVDGVDVIVRPRYKAGRGLLGRLRETAAIIRAVRAVDATTFVTRAAGPHVGLVGVAAKVLRRRFVYSSANVSDFNFAVLAAKRRDRALFALGVRLADEIVVQTDEQAAMCRERFGRSPRVIRSIAETADMRTAAPEAFLWIGRMVWYKRPLELIELARRVPEARFWLVAVPVPFAPGGPQLFADVEAAAQLLPNLEILEPRPRPQLLELMKRAVAIVNTADFEGLPNILLEGWSRGVPALVLTHDPDRLVEAERLGQFAAGDRDAFAAAARQLWSARADQSELAHRCRTYAQTHHGAAAVARAWAEVIGHADEQDTPGALAKAA
jgi:glycosyltransferase involved in cell wall biosynthesis